MNQKSITKTLQIDAVRSAMKQTVKVTAESAELAQVKLKFNGHCLVGTIDSGAQISLIESSCLQKLYKFKMLQRLREANDSMQLQDVQGNSITTRGFITLEFGLGRMSFQDKFLIVDNLPSPVLLGRPFLINNRVEVRHGKEELYIENCLERVPFLTGGQDGVAVAMSVMHKVRIPPNSFVNVKLFSNVGAEVPENLYEVTTNREDLKVSQVVIPHGGTGVVQLQNVTSRPIRVTRESVNFVLKPVQLEKFVVMMATVPKEDNKRTGNAEAKEPTDEEYRQVLSQVKIGPCDPEVKKRLEAVLWRHREIFSKTKWDIGRLNIPGMEHKIELKDGAIPRKFNPYRASQLEREIEIKFIEKMKAADLIEESKSEWSMPLMLLPKPQDPTERRPVVNCKYLNQNQKCVATRLPRMDDLLDAFGGVRRHKSKLDATQYYFQIPLHLESRPLCTIATHKGNYQSKVMLQGDANAPNTAQRILETLLEGLKDVVCLIDDIGVASKTIDDHLETIEEILKRLQAAGLKMRADKLELLTEEMRFMGFVIGMDGRLKIDNAKSQRVEKWGRPKTVGEVRTFLGFCGFVRKFVRGFSEVARPLTQLITREKLTEADWTPEAEEAFQKLKTAISTAPCLRIPDHEGGDFHLYVDASGTSIGNVLAQEIMDDKTKKKRLWPCSYGSRLFRGSEKNYSMPEKEILAAVWSTKSYGHYLRGRTFHLHTDAEAVYHVLRRTSDVPMSSRLSRFAVDVHDYHFNVHHVRTEKNWADAMSRLPVAAGPDGELVYREDEIMYKDPTAPPKQADSIEIDPIWVSVTTRADSAADVGYPGLRKAQQEDPEVKKIVDEVTQKGPVKRNQQRFRLQDGILKAVDKKRNERYVIPSSLVRTILLEEHSGPASGHLGQEKLFATIKRKYYWKNMNIDVAEWVRSCHTCQVAKGGYSHARAELGALPRPERGQEVIAMDVKGPYPASRDKKRFVIVAVDLFTKYGWTRSVPNVEGTTVANFLIDEVFRFGVPKKILTDNAPNLKESVPAVLYRRLGLENLNSTPYHPSSNGGVERLIQTLGVMVRCAAEDDPKGWSQWVQRLTTKYNHTIHTSTGFSPFMLHFAYEPREASFLDLPETDQERKGEPAQWLEHLRKTRERVEKAAKTAMDRYYKRMADDFNVNPSKKVGPHKLHLGMWVLVRLLQAQPGESKALKPMYIGPAEIMGLNDHVAKIRYLANGMTRVRNVSHLKPYFLREGDDEVRKRFTAPKRKNRRLDDQDASDDEEIIDDPVELDRGVSQGSPLDGQGVDEDEEDDAEDSGEAARNRTVRFAPDVAE